MTPTRTDLEDLASRQREARAAHQPIPALPGEWGLRRAALRYADLCEADLCEADLCEADLCEADLTGANLREANLREADLREADLREADLREADLREADLSGANLRRADLREADLREANLCGANLCGAHILEGVVVDAVAGEDGGYRWHALRLTDGTVALWYGCDRATLAEWRQRGPEYGTRYGRAPEHWPLGPAVAIAAAESLAAGD